MAGKRYLKDYRLVETMNEKGKVHREYEYIGEQYAFDQGAETAGKERRGILLLTLLAWALYLLAFSVVSVAARTMYVALPFAFIVLAIAFLTQVSVPLQRMKAPLTRQQADLLNVRYPASSAFMAGLGLVSVIGDGVVLVQGVVVLPGDVIFLLCAAGLTLIGARLFSRRRQIAAKLL